MKITSILSSVIYIALTLFTTSAQAKSSVWLIEKDGKQLYLGGTVHVLTAKDYPLPTEFDEAFAAADTIVFETDILALQQVDTQMKMMQAMMYQDGRALSQVLDVKTLEQLSNHLAARGMPLAAFDGYKAGAASMTLSMLELQIMGYKPEGVDSFYHKKALQQGTNVSFLESVDEQIGFLSAIGEGQENEIVAQTLADLETLEQEMPKLISAWRSGDLAALDEAMLKQMRDQYPKVYDSLLVQRNKNWLPQLERMLNDEAVEAVLVGAGHLAGDQGLLRKAITLARYKSLRLAC